MQFRKRKQILVNKTVQWASVAYVFVAILVILFVHTVLTYYRVSGKLPTGQQGSLPALLLEDIFITLSVMAVFVIYATIVGSHRVVGPLYRCEKALKRVQEGDLTDVIRLRRGDFLVPFSEELNLALANLREFAAEDRAHVQEAVRLITLARAGIQIPEVQSSLDRAAQQLGRVGAKMKIENEAVRARLSPEIAALAQNRAIPPIAEAKPQYLG
ncbi:MAG TPA: hypothetical protein VHF22_08515, partial [Planctomycetota bacterium]|nr:hypothetical protein [Planctomycetota bacterium]